MDLMNETIEAEYWVVPVERLMQMTNPMDDDVWGCGVIEAWEVLSCPDPRVGCLPSGLTAEDSQSKEYNVARIAWLMGNYDWESEDAEPICVEAWPDDYEWYALMDGNHRFSAALLSGRKTIRIMPYGDLDYLAHLLLEGE